MLIWFNLICIVLLICPIFIVLGVAHAKWLELINPPLKYENSNDEMNFPDLNMQKTRNIINHCS